MAETLVERLRRPTHHRECEDSWYSCPKSKDGCADTLRGPECDCGADERNALHAEAADTIDTLTRQLAAERERADRLRIAAENVREQWTNKHVVNTPLDKAVVELILALNDQSEPPDTGAKASRPSDPPAQQETRP